MNTAKVFKIGRDQAVRLPDKYRFRAREVIVNKIGDMVVLIPRGKEWDVMARGIERFSDDFMADRNQPVKSERRKRL